MHAITPVNNALIERKGTGIRLITRLGFRDILSIGTKQRYDIHGLFLRFPDPLVPRIQIKEVGERVLADGAVLHPLDSEDLESVLQNLAESDIESVAVSFLHAFRNPDHELQVAAAVADLTPEIRCSLSHQVVAEIREYERTSTTVANAYIRPLAEGICIVSRSNWLN